jgi:hypothetical protein
MGTRNLTLSPPSRYPALEDRVILLRLPNCNGSLLFVPKVQAKFKFEGRTWSRSGLDA